MLLRHSFLFWLACLGVCNAETTVTVYYAPGQQVLGGTATASGSAANYTGAAAYNPTVLNPPSLPSQAPAMQFNIPLQQTGMQGLSILQEPGFAGLSVEMSVTNQVLGKNSTLIGVPFLNLMANIQQRAGIVKIRVGGNSQESSDMVPVGSIPDGRILSKGALASNPTKTPTLLYTVDLLYMMRNISDLLNVHWFVGVPFNDSSAFRLQIMEQGEPILGDFLLGWQVGNEPDLYPNRLRGPTYSQFDYFGEFGVFINATQADPLIQNKTKLMAPSISSNGAWSEQNLWDTGFLTQYSSSLAYVTTEHYPDNNCAAIFGNGAPVVPQDIFSLYLNHVDHVKNLVSPFLGTSALVQTINKRYIMLETNTASCGGFAGLSDSFGAALWGLDYSLQLAYSNFSAAMMHVGGQQAFYNPLTPPPTNQSSFHQWTVGPIYYSILIMAEAMGPRSDVQVLDLNMNNGNEFTPGYAIFEAGVPVRLALFNYITDPTGASTYNATISLTGGQLPSTVTVKRLTAPSVSTKYNFTWAGQTFGNVFESDGRPIGQETTDTVNCDTTANTCIVSVPAPGFALVFLNNAQTENASPSTTFATTAQTKFVNTATINPAVLATSNGHSGSTRAENQGSTSRGSANAAESISSRRDFSLMFGFALLVLYRILY